MLDYHYSDLIEADLDNVEIPEPEYEIETYEEDDGGCEGGACKI